MSQHFFLLGHNPTEDCGLNVYLEAGVVFRTAEYP